LALNIVSRIDEFLMLAALGCLLAAGWVRRRSYPDLRRLAFVACWCFTLLLALRFGARTYPGFWFPHSLVLNELLNGSGLFVSGGYDLVFIATIAAAIPIIRPPSPRGTAVLGIAKWAAIGLAASITLYGFAIAWQLHRMPWDGS
jgi:hypothetical protein